MELKVGDTAEVIEITNSNYPGLYENGTWGLIEDEYLYFGACSATIGNTFEGNSMWHVPNDTYRKVGKLTVTKIK